MQVTLREIIDEDQTRSGYERADMSIVTCSRSGFPCGISNYVLITIGESSRVYDGSELHGAL